MQCSVIIPCHGGADLTRACIQSLLAQAGGPELEILLVDNQGDPATAALAAMHPCVRVLVQTRNLGFAGGANAGMRQAQHEHLLVLNNDTQAAPHLLERLGRALASDDRIAASAPVSNCVKGEALLPFGPRGATAAGRAEIEELLADEAQVVQDVDVLTGLGLLLHRSTLQALDGFDERFGFGNYEDDDLSLRARLAGRRLVIARGAFLHHEGHRTFQALGLDLAEQLAERRRQFEAKWAMDPAGAAVLHAHDPAAAAAFAARARRLHPAWPDADWWLGRHLAESGRHADAAVHLEAFLRSCPYHTGAVILLGTCWLALDQPARAQQLWRWAMGNCHFEPRQAALLLRRLGEHARARGLLDCAIENFAEAAALDPGDATLHNWLGIALLEARQFARAIEALERAAAMGFALAHTNLGICHFQAGDAARALQHFAAASKKLPDDPTAQQNYERAIASISPRPAGG